MKVEGAMDEHTYITELRRIFQLAPEERKAEMIAFHRRVCDAYCIAVKSITPERAETVSSDGRLVKQVVGHIMEWDRFTLICLGKLLSGVKSRKLLWKNGYVDQAGEPYNFGSLDAFNAFQAEHQANIPWSEIQMNAITIATTLYTLLSTPTFIPPALLEDTETISPELYDGQRIPIPSGWFLWHVILDHEAVEHARDLYLR
jgi:hypothetical protein